MLHRVQRKARRLTNEMRSILEERWKRPSCRSWPVVVNLNNTTVCNLRCIMCPQALQDVPQKVMSPAVYEHVRGELFERASELSLTVMGDPFCIPRPFFDQILDDVERYGLRLEITTNATLFGDDQQLERLARLATKIVISIDGATRETFERIRVRGNWERTVANVERLCTAIRRLPFRRRPLLYLNYVLMASNAGEFPLLLDHARRWGAYAVTGSPMIALDPSVAAEAIDVDADPEVRESLAEASAKAFRYGIGLRIAGMAKPLPRPPAWDLRLLPYRLRAWSIPWRPVLTQGLHYLAQKALHRFRVAPRECGFLWHKAYVQIAGRVSTCCHHDYLITGDLTASPFPSIWNGKRARGIRAALNSEHPAAPCRDCHLLRP